MLNLFGRGPDAPSRPYSRKRSLRVGVAGERSSSRAPMRLPDGTYLSSNKIYTSIQTIVRLEYRVYGCVADGSGSTLGGLSVSITSRLLENNAPNTIEVSIES